MLKDVKRIDPEKYYKIEKGAKLFKDGVENGDHVKLYKLLSTHGGIEDKPVIKVVIQGDEDKLPYFDGACFQKLHQHWIDKGELVLSL